MEIGDKHKKGTMTFFIAPFLRMKDRTRIVFL